MSEDYKLQVSLKFGPRQEGMLNVRGNNFPEMDELLETAESLLSGKIGGLVEAVNAVDALRTQFPGTSAVDQPATPPNGSAGGGTQMCAHGAMIFKSGGTGDNTWKGWFCPTGKGAPDKCKPVWEK